MRVTSLASGSSGNAYLVQSGRTAVLVEAGLSAGKLAKYLRGQGVEPADLAGILLTHAHADHLQGARELSNRYQVPVFATSGTLSHRSLRDSPLARELPPGGTLELENLEVLAFRVPHDCVEPVGFRLAGERGTICITTDLGFMPETVLPLLAGADLLVLEANHDEELLWSGSYPTFLKQRVSGGQGHLSNHAAAGCLVNLAERVPASVWLAHLSLINNREEVALRTVRRALAAAGLGHVAVSAAARNSPSLDWTARERVRQLTLL